MMNVNISNMYYEEYDDQLAEDFELVGIEGKEPAPIVDLIQQVNELRRLNGKSIKILVYRSNSTC